MQIPDDHILDSSVEIDNVLSEIAFLMRKKQHLKELKKHRIGVIDQQVDKIDQKIEEYRDVALQTMIQHAPDDKTLHFPGVGKITRKKPARKWVIEDETMMLNWLDSLGVRDKVVEIREKVNKKNLDKVLDKTKEKPVGVKLDPGKETISVVFDGDYKPEDKEEITSVSPAVENVDDLVDLEI